MTDSELRALINLLDDDQIYRPVKTRLLEYGTQALPYLDEVIRQEDIERIHRAQEIRTEIRRFSLEQEWIAMLEHFRGRDLDLEEGVWFIARIGHPDLDVGHYQKKLNFLARKIRNKFRPTDTGFDRLKRLISVLVKAEKYTGNMDHYYQPENSFLNNVVDRKVGLPITLSVLYLLVGNRVDVPMVGLGIPGHFMLRFTGSGEESVFIDPFYQGRLLDVKGVERFCRRIGAGFDLSYLEPVSSADIIERMLRNLALVFTKLEDEPRLARIKKILVLYAQHYAGVEDE